MIPNIVFIGKAGAGKTTATKVLRERFPELGFDVISFAAPLKVMLDTHTDRHRLQEFGTDVVRAYEPDAWVRLFLWHLELRAAARLPAPAGGITGVRWCNDDCRFPNELEILRDHGWAVVEVQADGWRRVERLTRNGKLTDPEQLNHVSEHSLDGVVPDAVIYNNGDEAFLAEQLRTVLNHLDQR